MHFWINQFQISEYTPQLNKICCNCSIRVQYAFKLKLDIIEGNEQLLADDGLKLTKLESTSDTLEVYKIVDLDDKASCIPKIEKETTNVEFIDLNEDRIDIEFLDADGVVGGDDSADTTLLYAAEDDEEDVELDESEAESDDQQKQESENGFLDEVDEDQDAVSFLLGNSHILDKMDTNEKRQPPSKGQRRPHSCNLCKKTFLRKSNLIDHLRLHANLRLYQCEHCDKSFVQAGNFKSHLRIHTKERPFKCTLCPKTYNQSSALKVCIPSVELYLSIHPPIFNVLFLCFFVWIEQVHIRSHTNERNYKCDECNKAFTNSSDLNKHKRVHDPEQKIKCDHCTKTFAQKVNWRSHMIKHHPTEPIVERK